MKVSQTSLPGVLLIEPQVFGDERGFFKETFHGERYARHGLPASFVQDNLSRSQQGVLRGLHYQIQQPQGKLVQAVRGAIFDVAVDLRRSSPTFGQWTGTELSAENHRQLYVPPGFAHGFYVLTDIADVFYKCSDFYAPQHERTVLWNDPALNIAWPLSGEPILSDKDRQGVSLAEAVTFDL